jgi:plasmid stabilization system protein ParE
MIPVTILHEAELELREAVAYYEEKSPRLGLDFEAEIEKSIRTIREFPDWWPLREDGTRRYLTHRFPYLVIYTQKKDHIWIIAIAHCKRRPGYWKDRAIETERKDER